MTANRPQNMTVKIDQKLAEQKSQLQTDSRKKTGGLQKYLTPVYIQT